MSDELEDKPESHPAYGLAVFSRGSVGMVKGGNRNYRLFGSSVGSLNTISLEISQARVQHSLGSDHYYDEKELIRVEMTEAQFAALLTTMNVGGGVPVTIRRFNGKGTPPLPETKIEAAKITDKFHERMTAWKKQMNTITDEIDAITSKKGALTVAEKERIKDLTSTLVHKMQDTSGFLIDQFNESTTGVIAEAKAEIEGFINAAIQKTGLQALKGQAPNLLGMDEKKERTHSGPCTPKDLCQSCWDEDKPRG